MNATQRFFNLLKPDSKEIRNIYLFAAFSGLINLSLPLGIQAIVNLIQGGSVNTSWIVLLLIVVGGVIATGILQVSQLRITENLQQKIFTKAAFEFAYRIPKIRLDVIHKYYPPELMNRFFDTISLQKGLPKLLIDFSTAILQIVFGLLLLSLYHPFFIMFSVSLLFITYFIFRFTAQQALDTSIRESGYKYKVLHWLEEIARTATSFKLAGNTDFQLTKTDEETHKYLGARESHFKVLVRQYTMMIGLKALIVLGLLAVGGFLVMEQQMNIGQFVAAEVIIILILSSVEKIIMSLETIYDVLTSVEKMGFVTDLQLERHGGVDIIENLEEGGLEIEIDNVSFQYPKSKRKTLSNISLEVKKGEKIMICGTNGSGKSSLLRLMAGLYHEYEGSVKFNGVALKRVDLKSLHSIIGDSLSHELLFEGTVLENITVGRTNATLENVRWAIKNLHLDHYINSLDLGLDTFLQPEGRNLPESIVQKLLLARSIADKPRLLLVEDSFEHIDSGEHDSIIDFLCSKDTPWTMIAVSSDKYLAQKVDCLIVMDQGSIEHKCTEKTLDRKDLLR